MTKSILFNVASTQLINILNDTQTYIITKRLPKDFTGWVYLACGKSAPYLKYDYIFDKFFLTKTHNFQVRLNSKIAARFWWDGIAHTYFLNPTKELHQYRAMEIKSLEIFDKPKEVGDFEVFTSTHKPFKIPYTPIWEKAQLTTLPTNWRYVWGRE